MKPEYRTLDPVGVIAAPRESIASLLVQPATSGARTRTIGDLARECDVTLRALRFYEGKGLLTPTREGSVRLYGDDDVRRLKLVLRLKHIGFSLIEIRDVLDRFSGAGDLTPRLAALLDRIERQVGQLEEQRREIDGALDAVVGEIDGLKRHLFG